MPVRIVFLLPSFQGGGAERVMLRILGSLDSEAYEPVLVVGRAEGPLSHLVPAGVTLVELGQSRARSAALPVARVLRRLRPDVVFSTLGLGLAALLAKPVLHGEPKLVMRLGNTLSAEGLASRSAVRERGTRASLRYLYRRADLIIAQSDYMLQDAVDYLNLQPSRFVRIYNPVDTAKLGRISSAITPRDQSARPHLVSIGKLQWVKGFDVLLDSFAILRRDHPAATLTILGEGPERESLANRAASLGIADAVAMPGWVHAPEDHLARADLFVLPSRFEGLSNALLEALALGLPAVLTDCPSGHREIVDEGRNAWFAPIDDPVGLAHQIQCAFAESDESILEGLAADLRQRLSTQTIVREYERVFAIAEAN